MIRLNSFSFSKSRRNSLAPAFTIVELLIVIVVISILATITIITYSGVTKQAHETSVKSDLDNVSKLLEIAKAVDGSYPANLNNVDNGQAFEVSEGNGISYNPSATDDAYCTEIGYPTGSPTITFFVTDTSTSPQQGICSGSVGDPGGEHGTDCASGGACAIGDKGPGGGIVFYDKGSVSNGWRYMEIAPSGWYSGVPVGDPGMYSSPSVLIEWGCTNTSVAGASGTAIGTGKTNTAAIIAANCGPQTAGHKVAAKLASEYTGGGYSDWFLPSFDEIVEVYNQQDSVPDLTKNDDYWTSTQTSSTTAYGLNIGASYMISGNKYSTNMVRPIRSF